MVTSLITIGVSSCTHEDSYIEPEQSNGTAVTLGISGSSAFTKGTSVSEVTFPTSEIIGTDKAGNSLYLNTIRKEWSVEAAATKVTPSTTADNPLQTTGLGVVLFKQDTDDAVAGTWTLLQSATTALKATYTNPIWVPSEAIDWPNVGKNVHFFVYGPYSDALNSKVSFTATGATQAPKIVDFEVEADCASQIDLLVANSVTSDRIPQTVGLPIGAHRIKLSHALAAIRFKVIDKTPAINVEKITIKNVYDKATYDMNTQEWSNHTATAKEYVINTPTTHTDASDPGYLYFDDEYTFMMIPSATGGSSPLPNTASIEIKIAGVATPIVANISTHEWLAGYTLTYIIDNNSSITPGYTYVIDAVNPTLTYQGGTSTDGKVISYKYPTAGGDVESAREAVAWSVEGYYPDATSAAAKDFSKRIRRGVAGTFVQSFNPSVGTGSKTGEAISIVYPAAVSSGTVVDYLGAAADAAIAAAAYKGISGGKAYNLSNPDSPYSDVVKNTANTYVINSAGCYRIPLVMGNGVKNGALNTVAYQQTGFVDYKNEAITDPYLRGTGDYEPADAYVNWQDRYMIEVNNPNATQGSYAGADITGYFPKLDSSLGATNGITITGSGSNKVYWLNFNIPADMGKEQGIAQIVARNKRGNAIWTWLIWLTDYQLGTGNIASQPLVDASDETQGRLSIQFMPRILGFVDKRVITTRSYSADEAKYVRLEQSESGQSKVVELVRPAYSDVKHSLGYAPLYQAGRFNPVKPIKCTAFPLFEDNYRTFGYRFDVPQYTGSTPDLGAQVAYVDRLFQNSNITDATSKLLWNAGNSKSFVMTEFTDEKVVKTIYDPCPVGYTVPRANAGNAFMIGYGVDVDAYTGRKYNLMNAYSADMTGFKVYTNWRASESESPTGNIIEIPFVPHRSPSASVQDYSQMIYTSFWTSASVNGGGNQRDIILRKLIYGRCYAFAHYYNVRYFPLTILPQKEQ